MQLAKKLYDLLDTTPIPDEKHGHATRVRLALAALGAAAIASTIYGIGVGSIAWTQALQNILKLPLVVVLPLFFSWPVGALISKLMGGPVRSTDLLLSQAIAIFGASLTLAALAPIAALFYHTTASLGGFFAVGIGCAAAFVGLSLFYRSIRARGARRGAIVPTGVCAVVYGLATLQVIALASPILIEKTSFANGLPGLF